MTIYQSQPSNVALGNTTYKAFSETTGIKAHYRDASGSITQSSHIKPLLQKLNNKKQLLKKLGQINI